VDGPIWYFAFGSNMVRHVIVERRRVRPISVERGRLDGYRLVFNEPGIPRWEPAFANIEPAPNETVHGGLYRILPSDFDRLTRDESTNYAPVTVRVVGERAGPVDAVTYVTRAPTLGLLPSRRYLELLCRGARELALPDDYVQALARQPSYYHPLFSPLGNAVFPIVTRIPLSRLHKWVLKIRGGRGAQSSEGKPA
jgi:hypothetical protein